MAKFIFKYETLLRHRQNIEDQRQRELAQQMRSRMILQDQLRGMQDTIRESKRQLGSGLVGRVDLDAIGRFAGYSGQTTYRAQQIVLRLGDLEKRISVAREHLLEATRQRKALELLKDRHREAWQKEQQHRETLEMDEMATQQFNRRLIAEGV